ncbi:MAG: hypothetical protein FJ265_12215 [Planctomycetes bacterium]|nr:hypothetical protein [Planctomycetota bacterium]
MISELLPAYVLAALEENEERLPDLLRSPRRLRVVLAACERFRVAAIGQLFLAGTSRLFLRRLHQSARLFAEALPLLPEEQRYTGRARPFLDAIAACDEDAARCIAQCCRRTWAKGEEFEEDFLFHELLMQLTQFGASQTDCLAILSRYEAALADTPDARLAVLRSLVGSDAGAFDETIRAFLAERIAALDAREQAGSVPGELLATEWHLSVEGVALVRIARARGMDTDRDYPHVPSVALETPESAWDPSGWRLVDPTAG